MGLFTGSKYRDIFQEAKEIPKCKSLIEKSNFHKKASSWDMMIYEIMPIYVETL